MLRPSPNHGTQRLPNDDDDDDEFVVYAKFGKIPRSRKQLPCSIHGFLREVRIHRLRSAIDGSARSTDCAQHIYFIPHNDIPLGERILPNIKSNFLFH